MIFLMENKLLKLHYNQEKLVDKFYHKFKQNIKHTLDLFVL